jgi:alkylation response protein AidB-like acyl-CoA dehydrogenase
MTEPGGAGSDPSLLKATARQDGNEWVLNGQKWLITGADGAGWAIVMAKMEGGARDGHATLFLVDLPNPAIRIARTLDTIDSSFTGGHAVIEPDEDHVDFEAYLVIGRVGASARKPATPRVGAEACS